MPVSKHDWMDFDRYLSIHDRCIEQASSYFVEHLKLVVPDMVTEKDVRIHGSLGCHGGLVIHVDNYFELNQHNRVRGVEYRYQAQFAEPPLRRIFRYDNGHVYKREGHPDAFHKHVFNDRTWREFAVEHVGREQFPTLLDDIDELYDWWVQHRDDPLIYP